MDYFRRHLGAKIFLSYLAIIVVALVVLTAGSQIALPSSFDRHMLRMMQPGAGVPPSMTMGPGFPAPGAPGYRSQLLLDYRAGFNDALLIAALGGLLVAMALSLFFSRSVVAPVRALSLASGRIAAGHYEERVPVSGEDELSEMAIRFNQMAEQLAQVESMRRRLIADVSHELRTPLTAIQGSAEGLIDGVLPPTDATFLQIHTEAIRLKRLVDDLQELSRVEAHADELNRQPVKVSSVVETVLARFASKAAARNIVTTSEVAPGLPEVLGDEDRLVQVLANLVGNALEYSLVGGRVAVAAGEVQGEIEVSVRDTGIGIGPDDLPRIFDRFYRVDKSRSRQGEGGGNGIGLTIAHALIEAHGGRLWAESAGLDRGSKFSFTLPIAK